MEYDYSIDHQKRLKKIQQKMDEWGLAVYLGSRLRTLSYIGDVFCPWRSFIIIPQEGEPTIYTFIIDAERVRDESWIDKVQGFGPLGGGHQLDVIKDAITDCMTGGKAKIGVELGMSNYLPEGYLTTEEYNYLTKKLPYAEFLNSIDIIDEISMFKEPGEINRFRKASRIVDEGHKAVLEGMEIGMTETEIAGLAEYAMRKAGSEWAWSFTGGNEIASGYRTAFPMGACTPATRRQIKAGEPLMVDLHAMYKLALGDHAHNYLIAPVSKIQKMHAKYFLETITRVFDLYAPGMTPAKIADDIMDWADGRGFAQYLVPGFEHGIGLIGDEWRIGMNNGPLPYWTNPDHEYKENMMLICAMQYMAPEDNVGFRYEGPIVITKNGCEILPKTPLEVTVLS